MMDTVTFGPGEHERIQDAALDLLLGAVEPADRALFDEHLAGCEQCRQFVDEASAMIGVVGAAGDVHQPPAGLRAAILAEAGATAVQATGAPGAETDIAPESAPDGAAASLLTGPTTARGRRRAGDAARSSTATLVSRLMAVAAAIALIGAVGWGVSMRDQRDDARADASHMTQVLDEVSKPGQLTVAEIDGTAAGRSAPLATAFVRDNAAMVVSNDLTANDTSSSIYVLWSMTSLTDSTPVAIGSFDVSADAPMSQVSATGHAPTGSWFAISLEDGRRVPASPTEVLGAGRAG
jgi:hypothetical protein